MLGEDSVLELAITFDFPLFSQWSILIRDEARGAIVAFRNVF